MTWAEWECPACKMELPQLENLAHRIFDISYKTHRDFGEKERILRGMAIAYGLYTELKDERNSKLCLNILNKYSGDINNLTDMGCIIGNHIFSLGEEDIKDIEKELFYDEW